MAAGDLSCTRLLLLGVALVSLLACGQQSQAPASDGTYRQDKAVADGADYASAALPDQEREAELAGGDEGATANPAQRPSAAHTVIAPPIAVAKGDGRPAPIDVPAGHEPPSGPWGEVEGETPDMVTYNVILAPRAPSVPGSPDMPVLRAGEPASLRFDLGPSREGNVISLAAARPSPDILTSDDDVPLDIVFACDFCAAGMDTLRHVMYRAATRSTNEVAFAFTPDAQAAGGRGRLELGIINGLSGREYDRLVIEVAVSSNASPALNAFSDELPGKVKIPSIEREEGRELPSAESPPASDVTLYAMWQPDHSLTLSLRPHGSEMHALLPMALDKQGLPRHFPVEITEDMVRQITLEDFGLMSALSRQGLVAKRLSAQGMVDALSAAAPATLQLTPDERDMVNRLVAAIGNQLHRKLFGRGGADLVKLSEQLDDAAAKRTNDRPLRLTVISNRGSLPWQYLYPGKLPRRGKIDGGAFWGMRYSLSVIREDTGAPAILPMPVSDGRPGNLLLARFENTNEGDDAILTELARRQRNMILELPVAEELLLDSKDGAGFLSALQIHRDSLTALVFFLHAETSQRERAPYLKFGNGDQVSSAQLEQLWNSEETGAEMTERYWSRGPLVFLNACETGPSTDMAHLRLDATMFQLGARGVVVTEAPVWAQLGHQMAMRLIPRLARGQTVPDALTATRREIYEENGNPLGVLYAYYGDPATRLVYP